ncbi:MAG: PHB depolymerase family esterase [Nevskiales bacterium]|nr:PHB depolymerase family esterase [Nevskiales bacterium]
MRTPSFTPRRALAALLIGTAGLSAPAANAGLLQNLLGATTSTVQPVLTAVTDPLMDPLIGLVQFSDPLKRTLIRINGRYLELAPGTAAFDVGVTYDGVSRRFLVIRPEPIAQDAPMVVMLHGSGGTPENQANLSEVSDLVADEGVWAVLPEAIDGNWNDDPALQSDKADVGFIGAVIDFVTGYYPIDSSRVYTAGLSDGSFMAERVGCELADRVAAVGIVAGALSRGLSLACNPQPAPRPIMFISGTADLIVPYFGGRVGVLSVPDAFAYWLDKHQCNLAATTVTALPDTTVDGTTVDLSRNGTTAPA